MKPRDADSRKAVEPVELNGCAEDRDGINPASGRVVSPVKHQKSRFDKNFAHSMC
jgi:hypothetical protein